MKKIFLISFLLIGLSINAQYFQHWYGDDPTNLSHGINTRINAPGHLLTGRTSITQAGNPGGVSVAWADENGTAATFFNNVYSFSNGGQALGYSYGKSFEFLGGGGFGTIAFNDATGTTPSIIYLQLDINGNVVNTYEYTINAVGTNSWTLQNITAITTALNTDFVYVTGTAYQNNQIPTDNDIYILKINVLTGAVAWFHITDIPHFPGGQSIDVPFDIVESPYQPASVPEVLVVGAHEQFNVAPSQLGQQAFLLRVNANTGAAIGNVQRYRQISTQNIGYVWTSIKISENTKSAIFPGLIIGGYSIHPTTGTQMSAIRTDLTGTTVDWAFDYDYSITNHTEVSWDIIERENTTGFFEYYLGGSAYDGITSKAVVLKLDEFGIPVPNGEFTYNVFGDDQCFHLDQFNNFPGTFGTLDGLSVYGTAIDPNNFGTRMFLTKAYFNGVVDCGEAFDDPSYTSGAENYGSALPTVYNSTVNVVQIQTFVRQSVERPICPSQTTLPGGSNARIAPEEPEGEDESKISPNPLNAGTYYAGLEVEVDEPTAVTVSIYDMLGRSYFSHNFNLTKGKNNLTLDISKANMAAGMYSIRVQGKNYNKTIMLMVK